MVQKKSMVQTAYELMRKKKKPITFEKLWNETSQVLGLTAEEADEEISEFYTELTLDGRIVALIDNTWDLRERVNFSKVHIDMNDVYTDDEDVGEDDGDSTKSEEESDDIAIDDSDDDDDDEEDEDY